MQTSDAWIGFNGGTGTTTLSGKGTIWENGGSDGKQNAMSGNVNFGNGAAAGICHESKKGV